MLAAGRAAAQEPSPLVVDADEVSFDQATQIVEARGNVRLRYRGITLIADQATFDLRQERLTASGRVVLRDAQGREIRGERLTYDVRTEQAEVFNPETVVDRIFVRSERLETFGPRIVAHNATITTCDPDRPAYRITATRIEVFPGDRIVASQASLWLGRYRIFTIPVAVFSLRTSEEFARTSAPRIGYNNTDGFWAAYTYGYLLGAIRGSLFAKYGTLSGFIANNTLAYQQPAYAISLIVGRNQNIDLKIFDQAELGFSLTQRQLGSLPALVDVSASTGWFRETTIALESSRTQYRIGLTSLPIPIGPATTWQNSFSWQDAYYGTGARQSVMSFGSSLTHQLSPSSSLSLRYRIVNVYGATPFAFDAIGLESRVHDLSLQYSQTGLRAAGIQTNLTAGTTYYFRTPPVLIGGTIVTSPGPPSSAVNLGYGERLLDRYHWAFSAEYNLTTKATRLATDSGLALGRGAYFTVQATYQTAINRFEDLDYILRSQICDCIDVSVRYRQIRKEIWLEVGLSAFPQSRLQLQLPGAP